MLRHFRELLRPGGIAFVSTPNLLTLAPPGADKSDNPWHLKEYRAEEFRALCESVFERCRAARRSSTRAMLRAHELALRAGWDRVHAALGITKPFYDRFTPAISASDFALRPGPLERALDFVAVLARYPRERRARQSPGRARARAALAHALRGGLRHLAVRRGVAVGGRGVRVPAAARPARRRARDGRDDAGAVRPARGDARRAGGALPALPARDPRRRSTPRTPPASTTAGEHELAAEVRRAAADYTRAERAFEERGRDLVSAPSASLDRVELWTSAATHALLPLIATDAGLRLQLATGDGLAHAALRRLGRRLLAAGVRIRCRGSSASWPTTGCGRSASTRRRWTGFDHLLPVAHRAGARGRADRLGHRPAGLERRERLPGASALPRTTGAERFTTCVRGATRASPTTTRRRSRSHASTRVTS